MAKRGLGSCLRTCGFPSQSEPHHCDGPVARANSSWRSMTSARSRYGFSETGLGEVFVEELCQRTVASQTTESAAQGAVDREPGLVAHAMHASGGMARPAPGSPIVVLSPFANLFVVQLISSSPIRRSTMLSESFGKRSASWKSPPTETERFVDPQPRLAALSAHRATEARGPSTGSAVMRLRPTENTLEGQT